MTRFAITLTAAADCPHCKGSGWHVDVGEEMFTPHPPFPGAAVYIAPRKRAYDRSRLCACLRPEAGRG